MKANTTRTKALTNATLKEIEANYLTALDNIQAQVFKLISKPGVKKTGTLTYAEMQQLGSLKALYEKIKIELRKLNVSNAKLQRDLFRGVYNSSYYHLAYTIDKSVNIYTGFNLLNREAVTAAMNLPISGLTLNETLAKNAVGIQTQVRQIITQGIISGQGSDDVAKTLATTLEDVFKGDYVKAIRVARTESGRAQNMAEFASMNEASDNGAQIKKMWIATLDDRTRDSHAEMDGQLEDENGLFTSPDGNTAEYPHGFSVASEDINCRCSLGAKVEGFEPTARVAKQHGKYETVGNVSFKDWKSNLK